MHILLIICGANEQATHTNVHSDYFTDSKTDTFETILHVLHVASERDTACSPQSLGTSRTEWKERFLAHGGDARSGYLVEKRQ